MTAAANTKGYDGTTTAAATPTITGGSLARGDTRWPSARLTTPRTRARARRSRGRFGQRRQRRQQLHGDLRRQHHGRDHGAGDHGHRGGQHQGLRRHDHGGGHADDHRREPGSGDTARWLTARAYDTKNAGTGKTLTAAGSVNDGNGGSNYTVTFVAASPRARSRRGRSRSPRRPTPRATTARPRRRPRRRSPPGAWRHGDTAAFSETYDTKNAGTGKTLTAAGSVSDGNSGSNYTVTFVANTTGAITARAITVTAAANTKGYDGTTTAAATPTITAGSLAAARHGGLQRDLRHQERGHGQDAHRGRLGQRRQQRQQLHGDLRHQHHRRDHGAGDHGHRGGQHQGLRRHDHAAAAPTITGGSLARATRRPSARATTPRTRAPARRSPRPARSTTATAATTTR